MPARLRPGTLLRLMFEFGEARRKRSPRVRLQRLQRFHIDRQRSDDGAVRNWQLPGNAALLLPTPLLGVAGTTHVLRVHDAYVLDGALLRDWQPWVAPYLVHDVLPWAFGEVLVPASAADQAIVDRPYEVHAHDEFWRPRFRRTGELLAVPLALVETVVRLEHEHVSPLRDQPELSPREVLLAAYRQRPDAAGAPSQYCGVWTGGEWRCCDAHNVYFVNASWSGHLSRTETTYDFQQGAWRPSVGASPLSALRPRPWRAQGTRLQTRGGRGWRSAGVEPEESGDSAPRGGPPAAQRTPPRHHPPAAIWPRRHPDPHQCR